MINHLRTLLLNEDGRIEADPTKPGEEYVPASYRPVELPQNLKNIHNHLFAPSTDRTYKNLRLQQYLTILHNSDLSDYVTALDARVTYIPWKASLFNQALPIATVTQLAGTGKNFYLAQTSTPQYSTRLYYEWEVRVLSATQVQITQFDAAKNQVSSTEATYSITDGLSSKINLPGTDLYFQFDNDLSARWLITSVGRPARTLVDVLTDLNALLQSNASDQLFGNSSIKAEPYKSCRNVWFDSDRDTFRLCAVALALGYRINELRV